MSLNLGANMEIYFEQLVFLTVDSPKILHIMLSPHLCANPKKAVEVVIGILP